MGPKLTQAEGGCNSEGFVVQCKYDLTEGGAL